MLLRFNRGAKNSSVMISLFDRDKLDPVRPPKGSASEDQWFQLVGADQVFLFFPEDSSGIFLASEIDHNEPADSQGVFIDKDDMFDLGTFLLEAAEILG